MQTSTRVRLFIVGPTASGKGRLAALLARRLGAEVISCDSMKLYRRMDIGTAKPSAEARAGVRFHLLDVCEPWEPMSVKRFCALALEAECEIEARGKRAIFAGGTALYVRALTEGLFDGPEADPELRAALGRYAAEHGVEALHARLRAVDPATAARLHPNDVRRVVRALEVYERSGVPISEWQRQWAERPRPDRLLFGLRWPRERLYERIDRRVERMFAHGFVDEVRALLAHPRGIGPHAAQALGYRELVRWIEAGEPEPLAEIVRRIQRDTRRFARRQLTFWRHFPDLRWIDVGLETDWEALADRLAAITRCRTG